MLQHGCLTSFLHQILFAWVVHLCYVVAMKLQKPWLGSKKKTAARSVSGILRLSVNGEPLLVSQDVSFPPSPVEIGGQGSFDSQDSFKLTAREQAEDFISTSGMRRRKSSEEPNAEEESVDDDDEVPDEVNRLLTSKNHSSDSPLEKAGADDLVAQKAKAALAPVTPKQSLSSRRRSSTTASAKASTLGSTITPAGVRQSARIRSSRKL
jgi:hypothetical protein